MSQQLDLLFFHLIIRQIVLCLDFSIAIMTQKSLTVKQR